MAELDGVGLAAVLAADADLEARTGFPALVDAGLDQHAHRVAIEDLEGIHRQDLLVEVVRQETADVVAREAEGHLGPQISPR